MNNATRAEVSASVSGFL